MREPITLKIMTLDRVGVTGEIFGLVGLKKFYIQKATIKADQKSGKGTIFFTLRVKEPDSLKILIKKLEKVDGVTKITTE